MFEPLSEISTLGSVGYGLALEAAGRNAEAAEAFKTTALFSQITPIAGGRPVAVTVVQGRGARGATTLTATERQGGGRPSRPAVEVCSL